jgi:hypothetical protein
MRMVVLGMMGRCPFGGQTWLYLNWLLGLSRLGHDVWYVEDDSVWPYDPIQNTVTCDCTYAVKHVAKCMERIGLADKWAFRLADEQGGCWGLCQSRLGELYSSCDVLFNVVGATDLREEQLAAPCRIYVETDPVVAELRLAEGDEHTQGAFANHDLIATYGENFGNPDCRVPLNGLDGKYRKTRQPIALESWPMCYDADASHFTTIGNYRQSGEDVAYQGDIYYWSKHREWEKFIDLPRRPKQAFEVALKTDDPADRQRLESFGWRLISPVEMSLDVFGAYQEFFRKSRGEFTVAKDQNVRLRSGWFSERDACYLATGKPVVAQDTGFGNILPTGEGLFAFQTMDDILDAIETINTDYPRHCAAAREIAEEYFAAEKVAAKLLADIGV